MKYLLLLVLLFSIKLTYAQTERKLSIDSLPLTIKEQIKTKYAAYTINTVNILFDNDKPTGYNIELQKKNRIVGLWFDSNGKLLKTKKSKVYTFDGTEPPKKQTSPSNDGHSGHQH